MRRLLSPLLLVLLIGAIALLCVWAQEAWLAPSIAAAAFTQVFSPDQPSAKAYSTFVGQVAGVIGGFAGIFAAGAAHSAKFVGDHGLGYDRVLGIVIAVAVTAAIQEAVNARSPAGATTAVVVAVGAETPDAAGLLRLGGGILLVTVLGELARRVASALQREPNPL